MSHLITAHSSAPSAVRELPEGVIDITHRGLAEAHAVDDFEHGYAQGARDVLSLYPQLIEQYLAANHGEITPAVRRAFRAFGRFVERRIGRRLDDAGFVDGAGI